MSTTLGLTRATGGFNLSPKPYLEEFKESVLNLTEDVLESGLLPRRFLVFFFFVGFTLI